MRWNNLNKFQLKSAIKGTDTFIYLRIVEKGEGASLMSSPQSLSKMRRLMMSRRGEGSGSGHHHRRIMCEDET